MKNTNIKSISVKALSLLIVAMIALSCTFFSGCGENSSSSSSSTTETKKSTETTVVSEDTTVSIPDNAITAVIDIKDYGKITVALFPDDAPITVQNFVKLAKDGFYDGLTFHRIINGFMMQGGDPLGNGTGGSNENIKGEFSGNGVENKLSHTRGAISMARSQDNDSASSQFFIVQKDSTYLDGQYAAFGYLTDGMDIVDEICQKTPVSDSNGTVQKANQPVINSITIEE